MAYEKGSPNKLAATFGFKCPRCHKGGLFEHPILSFSKSFEMPDACDNCGQTYMPEPGFYYGAMFISYLISAFFCLGFVYFLKLVLGWSTNHAFLLLLAICGLAFVWVFRISRSLWIHLHIPFK